MSPIIYNPPCITRLSILQLSIFTILISCLTTTTHFSNSMGSLHSPPPSSATTPPSSSPPPSPENVTSPNHLVYAVFSSRENSHSTSFSTVVRCYDPSINTWCQESLIPDLKENEVLKGFSMISIDDSIYIIGGQLSRKEKSQLSEQIAEVDVEVRSTMLRYNVSSKTWSTCAPLSVPRCDFACDVSNGKIFVAGGQSTLASARGISFAELYDPLLDTWTTLPNMNTSRYKCVGVMWQGKFHVIGGFAISGVERSSAEVYDEQSKKWNLVTGMWQLDVPPNQIVTIKGKLFSSGDCLNAWKGQIEAFDKNLKIWYIVEGSQKKNLASPWRTFNGEPMRRLCLTMAPIGTHLYIIAGYQMVGEEYSTACTMSMVHRFDTSATTNAWMSFEPMQLDGERELCGHCCVVRVR